MNLKKSFLDFCENKQYEINPNQLDVIKDLKDYHKNNFDESLLKKIFTKKKIKL